MENSATFINDRTEGSLLKQLISFSFPILLGNILQSSYLLINMLIVGNFIGSDGLAAVGVGGILQNLLMMAGMGISFGGQILFSQQVGAGNIEGVKKSVGTFFSIFGIFALGFGLLGLILCRPLLAVLNTPAEIYTGARSYFLICCFGLPFSFGYNAVCAVLRGMGESKLPSAFVAISSVVNILLSLLFVAVLGIGASGAALATVIAQGTSFIIALAFLLRHRDRFNFDFKPSSFKIDLKILSGIMKLSLPIVIGSLLMSLASMFINSNVNEFGVAASAVDSIGSKLNMIANTFSMAIYTGGAMIIGQCFGAKKFERVKKLFWIAFLLNVAVWTVMALAALLFPVQIFRAFTSDEAVLSLAPRYMQVAVISFLAMACAAPAFSLMEGVGNTALEMWIGIVENILVKIGLAILFSSFMGLMGFWLGYAIAAFTTPMSGITYLLSGIWKKRKPVLE
jgi:putative MATE family efflux protein